METNLGSLHDNALLTSTRRHCLVCSIGLSDSPIALFKTVLSNVTRLKVVQDSQTGAASAVRIMIQVCAVSSAYGFLRVF